MASWFKMLVHIEFARLGLGPFLLAVDSWDEGVNPDKMGSCELLIDGISHRSVGEDRLAFRNILARKLNARIEARADTVDIPWAACAQRCGSSCQAERSSAPVCERMPDAK